MPSEKDDTSDKRRYLSSAARKEEILDAALVEFSARTYNAVSMERLAECAGLSKAGIYAHFKSKEEIFHALLERVTKQLFDFQGWLPDDDLTLQELVDVYLDRLYTTFDSTTTISIYRLLLTEGNRAPVQLQQWREEVARRLRERAQLIIQLHIQRGTIRPSALTEHFFPLALAPALLWLNTSMLPKGEPSLSLAQLRAAHRQMLFELLQP